MIELLEARIAPATFFVTSLADDGSDGTLRKKILDANAAPGADTIVFKIPPAQLPGRIVLNGTEIAITDTLTIKGPGVDLLTVSGNNLSRIFRVDDGLQTSKVAAISNLTLIDGKSAGPGGAIYSSESLALKNVVIQNCTAAASGGGVEVFGGLTVSIVGSRIVHNTATTHSGGLSVSGGSVTIVKSTIADNTAQLTGGLSVLGYNSALIDGCTITKNTATNDRGGLYVGGSNSLVKNSLITANTAGGDGGGLENGSRRLVISNTTISNNTADSGGAMSTFGDGSLTISGSRFIGNSATAAGDTGGGAIYLGRTPLVKISSCLFSGNTSAADGGAISGNSVITDPIVAITGSTFAGNSAAKSGGAIAAVAQTTFTLTGNKLTDNRAENGGALSLAGIFADRTTAHLSGNLLQGNLAKLRGGAVHADDDSAFTSKGDKFIGNVAFTQTGGGLFLTNTGGIRITGSLVQGNVAASSGGGMVIEGDATLSSVKVLENIAGAAGRGGGIRITAGTVLISKSLIADNVADEGGGISYNVGTTTLTATVVKGNAASVSPNIGTV